MRRLKRANFLLRYNSTGTRMQSMKTGPKHAMPSVGQRRHSETIVCKGPIQRKGNMMNTKSNLSRSLVSKFIYKSAMSGGVSRRRPSHRYVHEGAVVAMQVDSIWLVSWNERWVARNKQTHSGQKARQQDK